MYILEVNTTFAAAHHLRNYRGRCENLHGHNWRVTARVTAEEPGKEGMVIDFSDLRKAVNLILTELDHTNINEHPYFRTVNPTSENLARFIFDKLNTMIPDCNPEAQVSSVSVEETPGALAIYEPQN